MKVKEVVKIAKAYVAHVFSAEKPGNIGLEEITFDEGDSCWKITVGFSSPLDYQIPGIVAKLQPSRPDRQYRVVEMTDIDGKVKAIKMRE